MSFDDFIKPGQEMIVIEGFLQNDKKEITERLKKIYEDSPIAREMFDDWIRVKNKKILVNYSGSFQAVPGEGIVFANVTPKGYYIDNNGTAGVCNLNCVIR